jgi:hypothetical protein
MSVTPVEQPRQPSVFRYAWFGLVLVVGPILILPLVFALFGFYAEVFAMIQMKE